MKTCKDCTNYEFCRKYDNVYNPCKYFEDKVVGNLTFCINRLQAEIEKLERTISYLAGVCESTPDKIRAEAVEEFVEKLKKRYDNPVWYLGGSNGFFDNLDNFVKEMVGDTE